MPIFPLRPEVKNTSEEIDVKQKSLFARLKRLFSSGVIVRNVGGKKLKVKDTADLMYATDRNSLRDRFNRVRSTAYNAYTRDFSLSYQAARIDLFRDYDCVGPDTIIPLPDGTYPTIKELTEKYKDKPQERFYVFSYDHETDSIKLGKAFHPRKKAGGTREGFKVTFDNGQYVIGSIKHPFLMRDGTYKKILDLKVGDSVMPFYQKLFYPQKHYRFLYNFSRGWQAEHKVVSEQFYREMAKNECVHHKNFDRSNNLPENLQIMDIFEHKSYHAKLIGDRTGEKNPFFGRIHTEESNKKRSKILKDIFKNRNQSDNKNPNHREDLTIDILKIKANELYKYNGKVSIFPLCKYVGCDYSLVKNRLKENGYNWKKFKNEVENTLNHKIISIECIGPIEVYDITVEHFENFASDSCFVSNTMDMDPIIASALDIYADECVHGDTVIPLLNGEKIKIEDLFKQNKKNFWIYSLNENGEFKPEKCEKVALNGIKPMYEITLDDGTKIKCTSNHQWVKSDMSIITTDKLELGTSLKVINSKLSSYKFMNEYEKDLINGISVKILKNKYNISREDCKDLNRIICKKYDVKRQDQIKYKVSGYSSYKDYILSNNHCVISIKYCGEYPAYDLVNVGNTTHLYAIETNDGSKLFTHNCLTPNELGKILVVRSDDDNIKGILTNLFYDILNVEHNLWSWTRNMCKYGDFYMRLYTSPEYGVYQIEPISSYNVERIENSDPLNKNYVKFQIRPTDTSQIETLEFFECGHFRLLSDSNFLPYGKCLVSNTHIDTEFGSKYIKDIEIGEKVWTFNKESQNFELGEIKNKICSGKKEIIRIKTQHNFIDCSKEHPILIYNSNNFNFEYKIANDIKIGDFLIINNNNNKKNISHKINKIISDDKTCKSDRPEIDLIPEYADEEFCEFLGFMLGDGWIRKYKSGGRVCFSLGIDEEQNKNYINILKKYSGKNPYIAKTGSDKTKSRTAVIYSKYLYEILKNNNFEDVSAKEKRIPKWIFEESEKNRLAFLTGFHNADGWNTVDKWANHYFIQSCNKDLIYDLKKLIQFSNIKSSIPKSKIYNDIVEICGISCNRSESHEICYYPDGKEKKQQEKYNFLGISENIILDPVRKIEARDDEETWDIQINSDNSNFIANGLVVHNSMIEPARRVWKQLSLMEDAMLIHRIMRAPEKRIFKYDIGNIPAGEVDTLMEKAISKLKKVPYLDPSTGDYNLRFNLQNMVEDFFIPVRGSDSGTSIETLAGMEFTGIDDIEYLRNKLMAALKIPKAFLGYEEELSGKATLACIVPETKIPLLNGKTKTISELINDHNNGIKNYVYSIDENTKNIVSGEIEWGGYTRKNAQLVRIWLDNNKYIDCTPDHNFMTRDGMWIEAQNLTEGQSLMPLYRQNKLMYGKSDYEQVYNPGTNKFEWTHKLIDKQINGELIQLHIKNNTKFDINKLIVIHHDNFSRFDNTPTNLKRLTFKEHKKIHNENVYKTFCSPKAIAYKKSSEFRKKKSLERIKYINNNPKEKERLKKNLAQYNFTNEKLSILCKNKWNKDDGKRKQKLIEDNKKFNKSEKMILAARKSRGYLAPLPTFIDLLNFSKNSGYNTKLASKNLKCSLHYIHNLIYKNGYSSIRDFFNQYNIKNHKVVKIEWLKEKRNTCDITIKNYHNFFTESGVIIHNSEDIRFAKTIQRIQKVIVSELEKTAIVHLYSQGYRDESLVNFKIELTNSSTIFEKEKIDAWGNKVEVAKNMIENKLFPKSWIYKNVFNLSKNDEQIFLNQIVDDSKQTWRLKSIEEEGNDPAKPYEKINTKADTSGAGAPGVPGGPGGPGEAGADELESALAGPETGASLAAAPAGASLKESFSHIPKKGDRIKIFYHDKPGFNDTEAMVISDPQNESPFWLDVKTDDGRTTAVRGSEVKIITNEEKTLKEKHGEHSDEYERPSQKGQKKASDYPFGEDKLGNIENNRDFKSERSPTVKSKPLSLNENLKLIVNLKSFFNKKKDIKKELIEENDINGKKSLMDESNILEE